MLTVHVDARGAAVAVDGDGIVAVGTAKEMVNAYPGARVREWPGRLTPGRTHRGELPEGPSPRERVHALLCAGVTAVVGVQQDPQTRSALARAGLGRGVPADLSPGCRADFAIFDDEASDDVCIATVLAGRLVHRRR